MTTVTTFDSTKNFLTEILKGIATKKIQLPDFQRDWIWDDERIRSLLASISQSFPIGAIMMLDTGNPEVQFHPRPFEGVSQDPKTEPEHLILDGQQRLTALYQALMRDQPVKTCDIRKKELKRWYYIDINKALDNNAEREDCIVALPEDKVIRNFRGEVSLDYSKSEFEYKSGMFPINKSFQYDDWMMGYQEYWGYDKERIKQFNMFNSEIIKKFEQYQLPVIQMNKQTPKEAVCLIFEKVNTGGVVLNVFELLTATYAVNNFLLRKDWDEISKDLKTEKDRVLKNLDNTDFLQAVTLLSTYSKKTAQLAMNSPEDQLSSISCKRKDILKLPLSEYKRWAPEAKKGFKKVARFLATQKIFSERDLPYQDQIIPLATVFALLGDKDDTEGVRSKISQWYWCGVLGELYGSATETRFAKDVPELLQWIDGGDPPITVTDANFVPTRLLSLRLRLSAAYKGMFALLLRDGAIDLREGVPIDIHMYYDENIDIHHLFPQKWCEKKFIKPDVYNSILNKTALSAKTKRIIGGSAPSEYLPKLQKNAEVSEEKMNDFLKTHVIDPQLLRKDQFDEFIESRKDLFLQRIEKAMGKPVARDYQDIQK